jgi:NAD-dependent SIR2 family protein deacetylase
VVAKLGHADVPACDRCGAILKPDVVFFGELLPPAAIDRAFELARAASLLLVVGSSLEVHPVAALPEETLTAPAAASQSSTRGRRRTTSRRISSWKEMREPSSARSPKI